MTDVKRTHVKLAWVNEDGTEEFWTKVPVPVIASVIAAGLVNTPATRQSRYNYLNADECPVHGPWRAVPGGTSAKTGKPYAAFYACDQPQGEERCLNKPSNEWVETHPIDKVPRAEQRAAPVNSPDYQPTTTAADFDDLPF